MAQTVPPTDKDQWLDICVHRRVHKKLTEWGRRLGLTPDGYAKLLIYQCMHGLLADEAAKMAGVSRETDVPTQQPNNPDDIARSMWLAMLQPYDKTPDLLPAPRHVAGGQRKYNADDFCWPEDKRPPRDEVYWDGANLSLA